MVGEWKKCAVGSSAVVSGSQGPPRLHAAVEVGWPGSAGSRVRSFRGLGNDDRSWDAAMILSVAGLIDLGYRAGVYRYGASRQ